MVETVWPELIEASTKALELPLKLRPTGLGSGIDKDRPDYTVYCGGWGGPNRHRPMRRSDRLRPRHSFR